METSAHLKKIVKVRKRKYLRVLRRSRRIRSQRKRKWRNQRLFNQLLLPSRLNLIRKKGMQEKLLILLLNRDVVFPLHSAGDSQKYRLPLRILLFQTHPMFPVINHIITIIIIIIWIILPLRALEKLQFTQPPAEESI